MTIACFASHNYYVDHLLPIWKAIPSEFRGPFFGKGTACSVVKAETSLSKLKAHKGPILTASFGNHKYVVNVNGGSHPSMPHGSGGNSSVKGVNNWLRIKHTLDFWMTPTKHGILPTVPHKAIDGMPKLDPWVGFRPDNKKPTIAISFRWKDVDGAFPHYEPHLKQIVANLKARGWEVLGHGHPLRNDLWRKVWDKLRVEYVPKFFDVIQRADVYAADNSGTLWDWAALDRPVMLLDAPNLASHTRPPRFTELNQIGPMCTHPLDLPNMAELALQEPSETVKRRREIATQLYGTMDGKAAKRAAKLLMEHYF